MPRREPRARVIAVAALVVLLALRCTLDDGAPAPSSTPGMPSVGVVGPTRSAIVAEHTDGDTVHVDLGGRDETVRLIGIDTPETRKPHSPVECFGKEASARLAELLPIGTAVVLETDVEQRDRYDRLLAYVRRLDDGVFVNLAMAAGGYASKLSIPPNTTHAWAFDEATADARAAGLGLWSACGGPHELPR